MRKIFFLIFICAGISAFAQKTNYVTYYTIKSYNSETEIPVEELKIATGFDTTSLSKDYKIYGIEYVGRIGGRIKKVLLTSTKFNEEMLKILGQTKKGDKLYFDFKVKDKTGKVISLPTHFSKVI